MRLTNLPCAAFVVVFGCATWTACRSGSDYTAPISNDDAGNDGDDDDASLEPEGGGTDCNPCRAICACTPGDTFFAPQACMTYTCGDKGAWGPVSCLGAGCDESGTDEDEGVVVEAGHDAKSDAPGDAPSDAAMEGSTDAATDVTTDAPSD